MAERRMTEVGQQDLVQMLDNEYDAYTDSPDPITIGEWLSHALGERGWRVVRPIEKPINRGRARRRQPIRLEPRHG